MSRSGWSGSKPCPSCQSKGEDTRGDNLKRAPSGCWVCFACGYKDRTEQVEPMPDEETTNEWTPLVGKCVALPDRGLTKETCQKWQYQCAVNEEGEVLQIAPYYLNGQLVAQKIRRPNKKFYSIGNMRKVGLFGQNLWSSSGRMLVITEGEIDALSVSQLQENKWPVVSVPNGSSGAVKAVRENLDWVLGFKEVVLCFDMDEPGQKAALEVSKVLPPGRCRIASLPRKDANEMLVAGEGAALRNALWQASAARQDGIKHVSEIDLGTDDDDGEIWEYPWWGLTRFTIGQRPGEICLWTSGTGSGKSTIVRDLVAKHLADGRRVGIVMLEESPKNTLLDLISVRMSRPVRRIRSIRALNRLLENKGMKPEPIPVDYDKEELTRNAEWLKNQDLHVYDHDGNREDTSIAQKIEYLAAGLGCRVIVIDHITAAVAGIMSKEDHSQERIVIDTLMNTLDEVVQRTGVRIEVICQLKKGDKEFEEGAQISLNDLRGASSLKTVPHLIIATERNRQDPNPLVANTSLVRVLKNRFAGDRVGPATALRFDPATQRLIEVRFSVNEDGEVTFGQPLQETVRDFGTDNDEPY